MSQHGNLIAIQSTSSSITSFIEKLPIPGDYVYFIGTQLLSLAYGIIFRQILLSNYEQNEKSLKTIHLLSIGPGLLFSYIIFGNEIFHLICLSLICYMLLILMDPDWVHLIAFTISILYLSIIHLYRLFFEDHYSTYQLDISAAMMILVQKVTSIAFSIHDGYSLETKKTEQLNSEQKKYSIRKRPSLLEYGSYLFNFQTIICGPAIFYQDYNDYLNGVKLKKHDLKRYPPVANIVWKQILTCAICAFFILKFVPSFPASFLKDDQFYRYHLIYKLWFIYLCTFGARLKYYFAWKLSEAICNVSGLGFDGFHDPLNKNPKYNLATNINIYDFEMSLSQRDAITAWNISTGKWLRTVAYDRAPKRYKVMATYFLSAFWHGFFPGYYLTFATAGLFTMASRSIRKSLRYRFVERGRSWLMFYHLITWLTTRLMIGYLSFPFVLLSFCAGAKVYQSMFWFGHLVAIVGWLIVPIVFHSQPKQTNQTVRIQPQTTKNINSTAKTYKLTTSVLKHTDESAALLNTFFSSQSKIL